MATIEDLLKAKPEALKRLLDEVEKKSAPPPSSIIDAQFSPYQYTEDVDDVNGDIVMKIGGREIHRFSITHPDLELKNINPEKFREQLEQSVKDRRRAQEARDKLHRRIEAANAAQSPDRLLNMVLGTSEPDGATALEALSNLLVCPDCQEAFPTEKALRFHKIGKAHGEFAPGMPMWEKSTPFRNQKKAEDADTGAGSGDDPGGSDTGGSEGGDS